MSTVELILPIGESKLMLDYYADVLNKAGLNSKYLYSDIFDTVRVENEFLNEVNCLYSEVAFGDYVKHVHQRADLDIQLEDFANVVRSTAQELYDIVSQRGFYNKEGILPYEFIRYRSGVFFLRHT